MGYWTYNFVIAAVFVLLFPLAPFLRFRGTRLFRGFSERLGFYPQSVLQEIAGSRPIWIHAVSVGEVLAALRLLKGLRDSFPGKKIVLSTSTATGRETAQRVAPAPEAVIYFPLDLPWVVLRTLKRVDPSLVIFLEKEVWPNFLRLSYRRGIPAVLISGRLSHRSFGRYALFRPLFSRALGYFSALAMQSRDDAERMVQLGVRADKIWITGNLKHDSSKGAPMGEDGNGRASRGWSDVTHRPVLVAGSTHEGEEEILLDVFLSLRGRFPLSMVLAPRHPHRFGKVEALLQKKGVVYQRKSRHQEAGRSFDVLILDTLGDLPGYYSLADIAFVGGSLIDAGGHNLLEPARFAKPVLFGPYVANVVEIAEELKGRGGGLQVRNKADLQREIARLLSEPERAREMGRLAKSVTEEDPAVLDASLKVVSRYVLR